jgi:8-oxo-dGTP diphosphatase
MSEESQVIYAAGAVLWRQVGKKKLELAIIHRPRYGDWSLPKGKLDPNETMIGCAYREVMEETGYAPIFGPEIGDVTYEVDGVKKIVKYWSAQAIGEPTGTTDLQEVDQLLWLSPADAKKKLTLEDDKSLVDFFLEFNSGTTPLVLLRHAKAVKREDWDGDDGDRPLAQLGQLQAKRMLSLYLPYNISEIHSSDAQRCIETIDLMARLIEKTPIFSADLSEYGYAKDRKAPLDYVQDLMDRGASAIVCSHNPIIPKVVQKLVGKKYFKSMDRDLGPAQAIVLHCRAGEVIACDWIDEPIL